MPAYLTHVFTFACGEILDVECVFAIARTGGEPSPAVVEKQLEHVGNAFDRTAVLVAPFLPSRDRKRLVERHVPFIVPFAQLYLHPLGIDFRERARLRGEARGDLEAPDVFTPVTQLVLLYALLRATPDELDTQALAETLMVSSMSISRAFRDLEAAGLLERRQEGRRRPARLARTKRTVWRKAQPFLASPVKARYLASEREIQGGLEAGVTALARVSNLAPPRERTVALSMEAWREYRSDAHVEPAAGRVAEPDQTVVEVWRYAPAALSTGRGVDILSLYLSLRHEHDERIAIALEEAMERIEW